MAAACGGCTRERRTTSFPYQLVSSLSPLSRLAEVQAVAGKAAPKQSLLDKLMTGDFDPEEYDKQMEAAFGDDYYEVSHPWGGD